MVDEVGRSLRERGAPKVDRIEGYVVQLRAEATLLEGFEGTAVVKADVAGSPIRVRVTLNTTDDLRACDAHRNGKRVAVLGTLRRDAKTYELRQPREPQVHYPDLIRELMIGFQASKKVVTQKAFRRLGGIPWNHE